MVVHPTLRLAPSIQGLLSVVLLFSASAVRAEMYKWTDEKGAVHYSNKAPDKAPSKVKVLNSARVSSYDAPSAGSLSDLANLKGVPASRTVEMYVTSWCPACVKAKSSLRARGILFQEYDVEKDPAALARAKSMGFRGSIPFFIVNGRSQTGYSQAWIDSALAAK